jgi:hypothetical protein
MRLALLTGIWLALAPPVLAQRPSDFELQAAHCLGIYSAMMPNLELDTRSDCASDASPFHRTLCEADTGATISARRNVSRLGDYLAAKKLPLSEASVQSAMKQGRSDYAATMGADHDCARGLAACGGDTPKDALERLDRCPATLKALPLSAPASRKPLPTPGRSRPHSRVQH